ncbi:hypothetical protein PPACK8108_LOCUS22654 [Phakopsora pachyrhizi]|uniref:Uncharacterized protein n=1 Tax=Phakopsora pachyrhizi TaxID=170000 RepID=A0AAV0BMC7_PHAPC|nr:hypothetical protein PPACK8108_LOCUS22654 [Phakopsora pachyrhizi]
MIEYINMAGYASENHVPHHDTVNEYGRLLHEYGRLCESKLLKYDKKIMFPIMRKYMNMAGYVSQNHANMTKKSLHEYGRLLESKLKNHVPHHDGVHEYGRLYESKSFKYD